MAINEEIRADAQFLRAAAECSRAAAERNMEAMGTAVEDMRAALPNVNTTNVLHGAAEAGYADAVKLLLDDGADVVARDGKRATALHAAARGGGARKL
jgi:ankyrin repeat protein